ncbi:MAG: hypothetical protein R2805_01470 [Flavobacterium sp.]|jgi:hypothetical protein|uniref:hypothetical protein n=1 Tax=Flavobacterium sp. TaxID=239 RepID=UPI002C9D3157|nr:hypothetical protein [Flavobacterium sp.]HQA73506.1 hypothetical protein [Flavobacterium sp.]
MKKLFFSAIALVAFSGVSFGNTIDIEEERGDGCQEWAIEAVTFMVDDEDNLTDVQYNQVFQDLLNFCYKNMKY